MTRPLRFDLVGTGHWARITHAPSCDVQFGRAVGHILADAQRQLP